MKVEPYFMKNKKWYKLQPSGFGYVLTDAGKQDPKVVASYKEYYDDEDGTLND